MKGTEYMTDGFWIRAGCLDCDRYHGPCEAHGEMQRSARDCARREGMQLLQAIQDWAEAIRKRPSFTLPCQECGEPTAAHRAYCDKCE